MTIREATLEDSKSIRQLFYDTINNVNTGDYNAKQIAIWSESWKDEKKWEEAIRDEYFIVAENETDMLGFASLNEDGYLDYIYVHKDNQRKGVATSLLQELEKHAKEQGLTDIWAHVSLTARPFFKARGFNISKEFNTEFKGQVFRDCEMEKDL